MTKYETLNHYYGHKAFRPGQEMLVDALLAGRDCLGIMPTGAGKSVCYQVPALMMDGITIVVSPLISLMKDQVAALRSMNIPAAFLNTSLTPAQLALATDRAREGWYRIIYVAPERLSAPSFLRFANSAPIRLVAVDEAHCVSQWGQDFRPDYLRIADFIDQLPVRPAVGAFTATATPRVREDIVRMLRLRSPDVVTTGFDRENLFFDVIHPKNRKEALKGILGTMRGQSGIVYCSTRKTVEDICDDLRRAGFSASRYHAGLSDEERRRNQEDFSYDRVQVMVATNAFGMGIDKSNVRFVIHYNMPRSMEAYYQEAGRAGRDGADAVCVLLYSASDIYTAKWMINNQEPNEALTPDERETVRRGDLARLNRMIDYCTGTDCLRKYILGYFGEEAPESCTGCGRCRPGMYARFEQLEKHRRSASAARPALPHDASTAAGAGEIAAAAAGAQDLFEALRACRMELARRDKIPPFVVCSDKTLQDMMRLMPKNTHQMEEVYGMGTVKVSKYGPAFLATLAAWREKNVR